MAPIVGGRAPTVETFVKSLKSQSLDASVESLVSLLRRRQIRGPEPCALVTANLLIQVVAKARWRNVDDLLDRVQQIGRKLVDAQPAEPAISNIIRRVLGLIRDEAVEDRTGNEFGLDSSVSDLQATPPVPTSSNDYTSIPTRPMARPPTLSTVSSFVVPQSMFSLLSADNLAEASTPGSDASTPMHHAQIASASALRSEVIDGIEEIKDEIGQVDDQIAGFADVQIHPGDLVLAYQPSPTVERFLMRAAVKRRYTLLLVGGSSKETGDVRYAPLRKKLAAAKVKIVNVATSGVMAYMPKANKVVLDARAVFVDGGVVTDYGGGLVARAAKVCGKTVTVLGGIYKLCPDEGSKAHSSADWGDPSSFVSYADGPMVDGIDVVSVSTEYIPPSLVDVYITNLGPHSHDHLKSVIADHYKAEDVDFYFQA